MTAFIVATVSISDAAKFKAYGAAIAGLSEKFGGEYILRGGVTEVLEGAASVGERVVVVRFATIEDARAYYFSDAYQAAKSLRAGGAELTMRLIEA